jgi:hypothetical protein
MLGEMVARHRSRFAWHLGDILAQVCLKPLGQETAMAEALGAVAEQHQWAS